MYVCLYPMPIETSAPTGAWKCKLPALLGNYDRPTNHPPNRPTDGQTGKLSKHNENVIFSAPWSDRQQAKKTDVTDGRTSKAVELASYALNSVYIVRILSRPKKHAKEDDASERSKGRSRRKTFPSTPNRGRGR